MRGSVAYLAAQEHVNDLIREAERDRQQAEIRPRSRIALTLPRFAIRWMPKTYRRGPANTARARA
jgi:hypothetical protein